MKLKSKRIIAFLMCMVMLFTTACGATFNATQNDAVESSTEITENTMQEDDTSEEEKSEAPGSEEGSTEQSSESSSESSSEEQKDESSESSSEESSKETGSSESNSETNSETNEGDAATEEPPASEEESKNEELDSYDNEENLVKTVISSFVAFDDVEIWDTEKETYKFPTTIGVTVKVKEDDVEVDKEDTVSITWDNASFMEEEKEEYEYIPVISDTFKVQDGVEIPTLKITVKEDFPLDDPKALVEWLVLEEGLDPISDIYLKSDEWFESLSPNKKKLALGLKETSEGFYYASQGLDKEKYLNNGFSTTDEEIFDYLLNENTDMELSSYFEGTDFARLSRESLSALHSDGWSLSDLTAFYYLMKGDKVDNVEIETAYKLYLAAGDYLSGNCERIKSLANAAKEIMPPVSKMMRSARAGGSDGAKGLGLKPNGTLGKNIAWTMNIGGEQAYCVDHGFKANNNTTYLKDSEHSGQIGGIIASGETPLIKMAAVWYVMENGGMDASGVRISGTPEQFMNGWLANTCGSSTTDPRFDWEAFRAQANAIMNLVNSSGSAPFTLWVPKNNPSGRQRFVTPGKAQIAAGDTRPSNEIIIPEYEFMTLEADADTQYGAGVYKESIITNEKLYGIKFEIKEQGGGDGCQHENPITVTTDEEGFASAEFKHHKHFSVSCVNVTSSDLKAAWDEIFEESITYPCKDQFGTSYATEADLKKKMDEQLAEVGGAVDLDAGIDTLQAQIDAFMAITYTYEITELSTYTHSLSGEKLPKFGYRMGNPGGRANGTTSSVQTTRPVSNADAVYIDFTNEPWYNKVYWNKADLESGNQVLYDAKFDIFEWTGSSWGQANYECVRITGGVASAMGISQSNPAYGMYTVHRKSAHDAYTGTTFSNYREYGTLYFTQVNQGRFCLVETNAPHNGDAQGYINNLMTRPYTKLNGQTDKTYPTPIDVADDIASVRSIHYLNLCADTNHDTYLMVSDGYTGYTDNYYLTSNESPRGHQYDSTSTVEIETTLSYSDIITYTGQFDTTKLNYHSYTPIAATLNARRGHNGSHFIEVGSPTRSLENSFVDERQKGFIRLTKFDIEAGRYVDGSLGDDYRDGTHHGDADLDGAIYSIYVDDSNANGGIMHPDGQSSGRNHDGVYAVMEEQQIFVDTNGDGYADTWKTQDSTLKNGNKIASAQIINGELEFDGLYLGNYYVVEEVRDVEQVFSHDNNGVEHSEIRKLSFAPGYYVETDENNEVVKHYFSFKWAAESGNGGLNTNVTQTYVYKSTTEVTNQQVIKGGIQLEKITQDESIGSGATNVYSLEGAGFSFFLVSELSKITNGTIKPAYSIKEGHAMIARGEMVRRYDTAKQFVGYELIDDSWMPTPKHNKIIFVPKYGYYFEADILAAYINQGYNNQQSKWDFSGESQALLRTYENDVAAIDEQNAKYQHVPNHKGPLGTDTEWYGQDGIGDGYLSYEAFTTKYAYSRTNVTAVKTSREYVLTELFTNIDGYIRTPLLPWGAYIMVETTVPADKFAVDPMFVSITDSSPTIDRTEKYYQVDESLVTNLHLVKRDAQSGEIVRAEGILFRIWDYTDRRYITVTGQTSTGYVEQISVFKTGKDGIVLFPGLSQLEVGKYRIEEIQGPEGYWNAYWDYGNPDTNPTFPNEDLGGRGEDADRSTGENMKIKWFGTVEFEVTTERLFQSSSIVTDNNLDCLYIGEYYSNSETLGELTIMKTGEVLVGYENTDNIQYTDDEEFNQNKSYKTREDKEELEEKYDIGTDRITSDEGEGAAYTDDKEEAFYEYDDNTYDFVYEERPLADATYEVIAAEDIYTGANQYNEDGSRTTWFKKGDIVATVTTANRGEVVDFVPYYNQGGTYEYTLTESGYVGETSYTAAQFASTGVIENKWTEAKMSELYKAIYGVPAFQDEYIFPNSYVNAMGERQCVVRVLKDGTVGEVSLLLPLGKYTVREIKAPYGFTVSDKTIDVEFTWEDQIKEIVFNTNEDSMADTQANIDRFVEKNLAWWLGGKNTLDETLATRIHTYTDDWYGAAEEMFWFDENGFVHFYNQRVLVKVKDFTEDWDKGIGVYKYDREVPVDAHSPENEYVLTEEDLADGAHPQYNVGEKVYRVDGEILWLKGAKFALYSKDDIYNADGKKIVSADQELAVAATDGLGFASFNVDIPYLSKHYEFTVDNDILVLDKNVEWDGDVYDTTVSIDGNTAANSGKYYIVELTPPEGYLINREPSEVQFTYDDQDTLYIPVYGEVDNLKTYTEISKRDITNEEEISGAELEVYWVEDLVRDEVGMVDYEASKLVLVDEWTSDGVTPHVIRGLRYSNLEVPRLDNEAQKENVYILREKMYADGYVTASDIEFEIVQDYEINEDGSINWLQTNTIYVNQETTHEYVNGVIKAQQFFTDHEGDDEYNYNHDYIYNTNDAGTTGEHVEDGCEIKHGEGVDSEIVANWTLIDGFLIIDIEDVTDESIKKSLLPEILKEAIERTGHSVDEVQYIHFIGGNGTAAEPDEIDPGMQFGHYPVDVELIRQLFEEYVEQRPMDDSEIPVMPELPDEGEDGDEDNADEDVEEPVDPEMSYRHTVAEIKESPFQEWMVIDYLPEEVTQYFDLEKLEAENPEISVIPTHEWMNINDAYSVECDDHTLNTEHEQHEAGITKENYTVVMHDERTKLWITKRDITEEVTVVGATITIRNLDGTIATDRDGNELTWVTDGTDHYIELLPVGDYILEETQAPTEQGYVHTESIRFTIEDDGHVNTVYMPDNYTRLQIIKTDLVSGEEIEGATLELRDEYGTLIDTWVTDGTPHYIDRLPEGTYTLTEILAPTEDGYTTAETITFEISGEDVVTKVEMKDDFTVVEISKVDLINENEIAGAEMEIYRYITTITKEEILDDDGNVVDVIETEETKLSEEPLYSWISGYKYDENGEIVIGEDGKPVLDLNEDGTIKPHVITHVPVGEYLLVEKTAPAGYLLSTEIEFTVDDKLYHYADDIETILRDEDGNILVNDDEKIFVQMKDDYTKLDISKVDITNGEEIVGAELEIYKAEDFVANEDGSYEVTDKPVYSWISGYKYDEDGNIVTDEEGEYVINVDENGAVIAHRIEKIPVGDYVLVEKTAPEGYLVAEYIEFTVLETGEVQGVTMEDERGILISKQNMVNSAEVVGAKLTINETEYSIDDISMKFVLDTDMEEAHLPGCEWLDEVEDKSVLKQTTTTLGALDKDGYSVCGDCMEKIEETVTPRYKVTDEVIEEWVSGSTPHGIVLDKLVADEVYGLVEITAPDGYFKAETVYFYYTYDDNDVVHVMVMNKDGKFVEATDHVVVMKDDHTTTDIYKTNKSGHLLAGARLAIEDSNGKRIAEFTTGSSYTRVIALRPGTYKLIELAAPKGYQIAAPVTFTVTASNTFKNPVKVQMVDIEVPGHTDGDTPDDDGGEDNPGTEENSGPEESYTIGNAPGPSDVVVVSPQTDDPNNIALPIAVAGGAFTLLVLLFIILKKRKKDQNQQG